MFRIIDKNGNFFDNNIRLQVFKEVAILPLVYDRVQLCNLMKSLFGLKGYARYFHRYLYNKKFMYQPAFIAKPRVIVKADNSKILAKVNEELPYLRNDPSFRYLDGKNLILDYSDQFNLIAPRDYKVLSKPSVILYSDYIWPEIITRFGINNDNPDMFKYLIKYQSTQTKPALQLKHKALIVPIRVDLTNTMIGAQYINYEKKLMRNMKLNGDIIKSISLLRFIYKLYADPGEDLDERLPETYFFKNMKKADIKFILYNRNFAFTIDFEELRDRKVSFKTFYSLFRQRVLTLIKHNVGEISSEDIDDDIRNEEVEEEKTLQNKVNIEVNKTIGNNPDKPKNTKFISSGSKDNIIDTKMDYEKMKVDFLHNWWQSTKSISLAKYEPPLTYDEIIELYGKDTADKLKNDPVHAWRMKTGLELIHKEPTRYEQLRIWQNWNLMSLSQKKTSDIKSKELFKMTNTEHHEKLMDEWDKKIKDTDKKLEIQKNKEIVELIVKDVNNKDLNTKLSKKTDDVLKMLVKSRGLDPNFLKYNKVDETDEEEIEEDKPIIVTEDETYGEDDTDLNNDAEENETPELTAEEEEELYGDNKDTTEENPDLTDEDRKKILESMKQKQSPPMSKKEQRRIAVIRDKYKSIKVDEDKTMEELLEDVKASTIDSKTSKTETVVDESTKTCILQDFEQSYIKKTMRQDIVKTVRSFSTTDKSIPLHIIDYKEKDTSDRFNNKKTVTFSMEDETHKRHNIKFDVPVPDKDGFLYIAGNKKVLKKQIVPLPLIKVDPDRVIASSYNNKTLIERKGTVLNRNIMVVKKLIEEYLHNDPVNFTLNYGNNTKNNKNYLTSLEYDDLSKNYNTLIFGKKGKETIVYFNQNEIRSVIKSNKLEYKLTVDKLPIAIDFNIGKVYDYDLKDQSTSVCDIILDIIREKGMIPEYDKIISSIKAPKRRIYTQITLISHDVPLIAYLGAMFGLKNVMYVSGLKYTFSSKPIRGDTRLSIKFKDGFLYYNEYPVAESMLFNGLSIINTEDYTLDDFDTPLPYSDYLYAAFKSRNMFNGWTAFKELFLDNVTKEILVDLKLPTDFLEFFLYANEMLADSSFTKETRLENYRIRGYEIISVAIYKAIAKEYQNLKQKKNNARTSLSIPQDEIMKILHDSQILENYDTINPINEIKTKSICTYKGNGVGGTKMQHGMTLEKRVFGEDAIGVYGISNVDNGSVGVIKELTVNPKILNTRGYIDSNDDKEVIKDMSAAQTQTVEELITPDTTLMDHPNRIGFNSGQWKHTIGVQENCIPFVCTGFEKTISSFIGDTFVKKASKKGVVTDINEKTKQVVVTYEDKTAEIFEYGKNLVRNSSFFLSTDLTLKVKIGDKVKEGDILAYAKDFFVPQNDELIFTQGVIAKVAIMDSYFTEEDSSLISSKLATKMSNPVIKRKQKAIGIKSNVIKMAKIGDYLQAGDTLMMFEDEGSESSKNEILESMGDIDEDAMEDLLYHATKSPITGNIIKIDVYWTEDPNLMSESCRKIVNDYIKRTKEQIAFEEKHTGQKSKLRYNLEKIIPKRNRVNGVEVDLGGSLVIEFYIEHNDDMAAGWKLTFTPAIKSVVAQTTPKDFDPYTVSGPLDAVGGFISTSNRQVNSSYLIGSIGKVLFDSTKNIANEYFK
jgi:hypothetical protein